MGFLVFAGILYTGKKGFKAPSEAVHGAGYPRIWVLVIEGCRNVRKGNVMTVDLFLFFSFI